MNKNTQLYESISKLMHFIAKVPLAVYVGLGIWIGLLTLYYILFHTIPARHIWNFFLPGATVTVWWLICYPPKQEYKSLYMSPSRVERRQQKATKRINFLWLIVSLILIITICSRHT